MTRFIRDRFTYGTLLPPPAGTELLGTFEFMGVEPSQAIHGNICVLAKQICFARYPRESKIGHFFQPMVESYDKKSWNQTAVQLVAATGQWYTWIPSMLLLRESHIPLKKTLKKMASKASTCHPKHAWTARSYRLCSVAWIRRAESCWTVAPSEPLGAAVDFLCLIGVTIKRKVYKVNRKTD